MLLLLRLCFMFNLYLMQFIDAVGIAPVISYNYGANDVEYLTKLHHISLRLIMGASLLLTGVCTLFDPAMVAFFARDNQSVYSMALHGFRIFQQVVY